MLLFNASDLEGIHSNDGVAYMSTLDLFVSYFMTVSVGAVFALIHEALFKAFNDDDNDNGDDDDDDDDDDHDDEDEASFLSNGCRAIQQNSRLQTYMYSYSVIKMIFK
uniref:Uncharacterized protein n=1 Tax=Glossina pallidipes TaxID=7398 RepID=A0A1A9ZJK9_GLOPL